MRILQLIDSLEAGGAERMAVNYANGLVDHVPFSGLVATRKEGPLKTQLHNSVHYLFLDRKSTFDIKALLLLRDFVKKNQISIIQAHSSSFLLAIFLKLVYPKIKIVWHDHYGNSEFLEKRKKVLLQFGSLFFYRIIVVNELLKKWAIKNLFCKQVFYQPNFVLMDANKESIVLQGQIGKRILCLANLRPQKNHSMLLEIAKNIKFSHPEWTFHLIGKDFRDQYSADIHNQIVSNGLENNVFIYGSSNAVATAIQQSTIGVLTSISEGLPVSLLEYGYFGLPVIITAVGEIPKVINQKNGLLVPPKDKVRFQQALEDLIENVDLRNSLGEQLKKDIHLNYTKETVFKNFFAVLNNES
ncbi:glycosyltransferase [Flavobacterium sp. GT3R68]|uniref:glycosyltransferase n=1 Tax=Flavobacterium sp. GT3R68 TaxID=2594437 RepID=UPI000F88F4CC|nr:glycosyltransferase [Flavobacterium sp. GT3R68]RTY92247.1 glycosyltransferase [Flavobacterium sp. GSN2]TRW92483.1 glycosyltransferase family 4 protein [Flavobacterium sp. GT3R68]